jgi:7-keto-8-aminopelargonate synthetase-like enzyme
LVTSKAGTEVIINDRPMLMFASNNYLGLAGDQRLIDAAIAATQTYGTGATGSRLVSGHLPIHQNWNKRSPSSSKPKQPWYSAPAIWQILARSPPWWANEI